MPSKSTKSDAGFIDLNKKGKIVNPSHLGGKINESGNRLLSSFMFIGLLIPIFGQLFSGYLFVIQAKEMDQKAYPKHNPSGLREFMIEKLISLNKAQDTHIRFTQADLALLGQRGDGRTSPKKYKAGLLNDSGELRKDASFGVMTLEQLRRMFARNLSDKELWSSGENQQDSLSPESGPECLVPLKTAFERPTHSLEHGQHYTAASQRREYSETSKQKSQQGIKAQ